MSYSIGIRELKNQASRIVKEVREVGAEYVITLQGKPVAILRPFTEEDAQQMKRAEIEAELAAMQALAAEVAASWVSEKSGVGLVEEQRR